MVDKQRINGVVVTGGEENTVLAAGIYLNNDPSGFFSGTVKIIEEYPNWSTIKVLKFVKKSKKIPDPKRVGIRDGQERRRVRS